MVEYVCPCFDLDAPYEMIDADIIVGYDEPTRRVTRVSAQNRHRLVGVNVSGDLFTCACGLTFGRHTAKKRAIQ